MPKPYVILTAAASLDGRADTERSTLLSNRLEEDRLAELRGTVDVIITSVERLNYDDLDFVSKSVKKPPMIVIVDKNAETDPKATVLKRYGRVMLATSKKAHKSRTKRLEGARKDLIITEFGEHAVNLEDLIWEMGKGNNTRILIEADHSLNMRLLDHDLVDELYVLLAPVLMGSDYEPVFGGRLECRKGLSLEGIIQYGDHIVLHYGFVEKKARNI